MKITLAYIGEKPKSGACRSLIDEYVKRAGRFLSVAEQGFATAKKFAEFTQKEKAAGLTYLLLCDPRGELFTSEQIAENIEKCAGKAVRHLMFAIGPADGWSQEQRHQSDGLMSFGRITLPHELCLVVLAEQVYRALTIRAGHPYHHA